MGWLVVNVGLDVVEELAAAAVIMSPPMGPKVPLHASFQVHDVSCDEPASPNRAKWS